MKSVGLVWIIYTGGGEGAIASLKMTARYLTIICIFWWIRYIGIWILVRQVWRLRF